MKTQLHGARRSIRSTTLGRRLVRVTAGGLLLILCVLGGRMAASKMIVVAGPSMEPTMHTGDMVFVWPQSRYEVGEALVYRVPEDAPGAGALVIHRLVGFQGEEMILRGDNNEEVDPWTPTADDIVGKQRILVPRLGLLAMLLRQPAVLASLVAGIVSASVVLRTDKEADGPGTARTRVSGPASNTE